MYNNNDFKNVLTDQGVSPVTFMDYIKKIQDAKKFGGMLGVVQGQLAPNASTTPYIVEEKKFEGVQIDIFSRLMSDRIIWINSQIEQRMAGIIQAQLLYMSKTSEQPISLYINTPGGCVNSGLGIHDMMKLSPCEIVTVNMGMCASMGSVLVSSGTKGKRFGLPSSRVMVHQSSGGAGGHIEDARITMQEWDKLNDHLFAIIAENTGKSIDEVTPQRDKWFSVNEAIDFGLLDGSLDKLI